MPSFDHQWTVAALVEISICLSINIHFSTLGLQGCAGARPFSSPNKHGFGLCKGDMETEHRKAEAELPTLKVITEATVLTTTCPENMLTD